MRCELRSSLAAPDCSFHTPRLRYLSKITPELAARLSAVTELLLRLPGTTAVAGHGATALGVHPPHGGWQGHADGAGAWIEKDHAACEVTAVDPLPGQGIHVGWRRRGRAEVDLPFGILLQGATREVE